MAWNQPVAHRMTGIPLLLPPAICIFYDYGGLTSKCR
jgi:hypothetical protein